MRICGAKYPVCGPKTASGRPLADSAADTTSAFDIAIVRNPGGSSPPSGPRAVGPSDSTTGVLRNEPASAIARPPRAGRFGGVW